MQLRLFSHALLLTMLALPAAAQDPSPSLVADSVRQLERDALARLYGAAPPRGAGANEHLRHALVSQQLYELTGDVEVRRAAERSFDRAKDLDPQLAWAHYGYGWALARAGGIALPGVLDAGTGPGSDGFSRYYEDRLFITPENIHIVHDCRNLVRDLRSVIGSSDPNVLPAIQDRLDESRRRGLEFERRSAREVYAALRTEDASPDYDVPLPILTSVYTFRGDSTSDVTVPVLVPGEVFTPVLADEGAIYPLRVVFAIRDSLTGRTSRRTVRGLAPYEPRFYASTR
jgi:hypothetical protein